MILIVKHNEIYAKILCDKIIAFEIYEKYSFYAKNYFNDIRYQTNLWDGKIHLFKLDTLLFPVGLLPDLIRFFIQVKYEFKLDPEFRLIDTEKVVSDVLKKGIKNLKHDLYDYQKDVFKKIMKLNRGLVLSPTSSGKSLIIYVTILALLKLLPKEEKILICVPSIGLVKQLKSDFIDYEKKGIAVSRHTHLLLSGKSKRSNKRVFVGTWAMILRQTKMWFEQFNCFIVDEAHQANTDAFTKVMERMTHIRWRFGFTGTLDGTKVHELQVRSWFGTVVKSITTKEMIDRNIATPVTVKQIYLQYDDETRDVCQHLRYQDEIKFLINNEERNALIVKTAMTRPKNTLILFNNISHGQELIKMANEYNEGLEHKKTVELIYGKVDPDERERIRQSMEESDDVILFANYKTFSVGISVKNLHYLIFGHPYRALIRNLQSIGRTLRLHDSKEKSIIIDFVDDLTWEHKHNTTYKHGLIRYHIFDDAEFPVSAMKLNLHSG